MGELGHQSPHLPVTALTVLTSLATVRLRQGQESVCVDGLTEQEDWSDLPRLRVAEGGKDVGLVSVVTGQHQTGPLSQQFLVEPSHCPLVPLLLKTAQGQSLGRNGQGWSSFQQRLANT